MRNVDQIWVRLHFELVLSIALSDFEGPAAAAAVGFPSFVFSICHFEFEKYKI